MEEQKIALGHLPKNEYDARELISKLNEDIQEYQKDIQEYQKDIQEYQAAIASLQCAQNMDCATIYDLKVELRSLKAEDLKADPRIQPEGKSNKEIFKLFKSKLFKYQSIDYGNHILIGRKIEAIKLVRDHINFSLEQCKDFVSMGYGGSYLRGKQMKRSYEKAMALVVVSFWALNLVQLPFIILHLDSKNILAFGMRLAIVYITFRFVFNWIDIIDRSNGKRWWRSDDAMTSAEANLLMVMVQSLQTVIKDQINEGVPWAFDMLRKSKEVNLYSKDLQYELDRLESCTTEEQLQRIIDIDNQKYGHLKW